MTDHEHPSSPDAEATDWDAFEPLYEEHHRHLYRVALLLCNGREDMAEDAVADSFVRSYRAWSGGGLAEFLPYARDALVDHVLHASSRGPSADTPGDALVDHAGGVAFHLLEHLPVDERTAVVLRYYEDLPYDAIASAMHVSVRTATSHVSAGVTGLRQQIRKPPS